MREHNFSIDYDGRSITFYLPNPEDFIQNKIIQTKNFYEIDLLEEVGRFPLKKGIFCDIGANIGNHTVYFASILNREVYSFEPLDDANTILIQNIELNGLGKKVRRFQVAVGANESQGKMSINKSNLGASKLNIVKGGDILIEPLDNLIDENTPVSLLKIDVEGFEIDVIKGAKRIIKKYKPLILVEAQTHIDFLNISKALKKLGYRPIGHKAATKTIFFIAESTWEKSATMCTYLTRNDIDHSRRVLQSQSDKISRKVNEVLAITKGLNLDNLQQSIDQFIELQNVNTHNVKKSVSSIESALLKNNSIEKISNQIDALTQLQNLNTNIVKKSVSSIESSFLDTLNNTNKKIKLLDEISILIQHPSYNKKNETLENIKKVKKYLWTLEEINRKLYKKIDVLYSSKTWRVTQIFRTIFGNTPQTFKEFEKKLSLKYGDKDILRQEYKTSDYILNTNVKQIFSIQKILFDKLNNKINTIETIKTKPIKRFATLKGRTTSKKTFIGIAAIPSREIALKETINSLVNQVDELGVYLNGWKNIPDYLKNPKIKIIRSQDEGDIGDAGKFYWVDNHEGYYFTCDDDIVYPRGYITGIIQKIKQYKFKAIIGWHGSVIIEPFENYYTATSRRVFAFGSNRPDDTFVHILGTGTIGFHTSTINVKLKDFIKPNMADVFFAELGQNQKIPFIVMKHEAKKMVSIEEVQSDSINKHGINNVASKKNTKEFQNQLVKKINWKLFNANKLKVLMLGRFDTFTKGGIHKSNHLIKNTLEELGHKVIAFDSQSESFNIEKDIDMAIIYPGDPNRPDFEHAENKMHMLREKGIPICINISYNTCPLRSAEIVKKIKYYNSKKELAPVFLMTFSDIALSDSMLSEIKDFIVPLPKTVMGDATKEDEFPSFSSREGIVLGDATKLMNTAITGGDITPWVTACKKLLPHVKLYVFKQYGGKFDIPGVETVPYMKEGFLDWTSQRRIFVCLNTITTFEMTPTEAQIVGTPIIYRPMPQSLTEYVGRSGISVTSPEEFAEMCAWLYNDQFAWESYSNLSLKNAQTNKLENLSIGLETSLRKILFKTKLLK